MIKKTTEEFITESKNKFGDKFDYSKTNYINNNIDIILLCKPHNYEFTTKPRNHLSSESGCCKFCSNKSKSIKSHQKQTKSEKQFIEDSKNKFGDKFDYSLCNYNGTKNNITLKCNICNNLFDINAHSHLNSKNGGCKYCARNENVKARKITADEVIEKCKQRIDSDNFNFNTIKNTFIDTRHKIKIECKTHGMFWMLPDNFYNKLYNCPECIEKSKGEKIISKYLKKNNIEFIHNHKFLDLYEYKGHYLSYDFYIPSKNMLIEYNGIQHYKFFKRFHKTEKDFKNQRHRDWLKRKYAKVNNFNYIVIDCRKIKYKELEQFIKLIIWIT